MIAGLATGGVLAREQLGPYTQPLITKASEWLPFLAAKERRFDNVVTETVKRGPFTVTVTERGTLDAVRNSVLASKVEGSTTIISIVPEGTQVKVGDLVCELDSSALVEKETQQQISVTQAESALRTATENVEIQKTQNESDVAAAKLALDLAKLDLEKFQKGDYEQQLNELTAQVTLAKEKVAQAEETYEFTERLVKKGYKTQNELESARITLQTEKINLGIAEGKKRLLEEYDKVRTETELQANAIELERELERVKRKATAALTQAEAELAAKRLTYDVELSKHTRMKEQIANCKIYATSEGQVVYANDRDGSRTEVLIMEGATVRERQPIINLPDLSEIKVNARIHESRISQMRVGLQATVRVDAYPDDDFPGVVDKVASVPTSTGSYFSRDLKEYEAVVKLQGSSEEVSKLRPGLTAEIEVLVSSRDNVLQAPVQSVLTVVNQQIAFVLTNGKAELRQVKIGQSNDRMVEIIDGLDVGDEVVMNPKSQFEREIKDLESRLIKQQAEKSAEDGATSVPPESQPTLDPSANGTPGDGAAGQAPTGSEGAARPAFDPLAMFQRMDANGDKKLAPDEWSERFRERAKSMDSDGDGVISLDEFKTGFASRPPGGPTNGLPQEQAGGGG